MKQRVLIGFINIILMGGVLAGCGHLKQSHQDTVDTQNTNTSHILASRVFYGSDKTEHIAGGQLLFDYLLDQPIGQYMDWQDIVYMQNAVLQTPVNCSVTWTNQRRGVTYIVRPIKVTYASTAQRYCRRYEMIVKTKHQVEKTFGRVCHEADGHWHAV